MTKRQLIKLPFSFFTEIKSLRLLVLNFPCCFNTVKLQKNTTTNIRINTEFIITYKY